MTWKYLLTVRLGGETMNAWAQTDPQARSLARLIFTAAGVDQVDLHKETPDGLELLLTLGGGVHLEQSR